MSSRPQLRNPIKMLEYFLVWAVVKRSEIKMRVRMRRLFELNRRTRCFEREHKDTCDQHDS